MSPADGRAAGVPGGDRGSGPEIPGRGEGRKRRRKDGGGAAAGTGILVALAAIGLFATGCSTGGTGVEDEGPVHPESNKKAAASSVPATGESAERRKVNPVAMIRSDPKVSARIKADLKPCSRDSYPVDTAYGNLTGGLVPDVVINVMTCNEGSGVGTYVYRLEGTEYRNVFANEDPAVYGSIDRGDLVVNQQMSIGNDPLGPPDAEEVSTYDWVNGEFTRIHLVRHEFTSNAGRGELIAPEPPSQSEN
ncbi:hypothetical protein [Streptomyces sp. CAU 1734]|uniref:hypothetical protein n=1 Tax=Streptomyces sp. CAU 1734 TaxID=3140360 RepID=UPI003261A3C1